MESLNKFQQYQKLIGKPVVAITPLPTWSNSYINLVLVKPGSRVIVKVYRDRLTNKRDKLAVEFKALEFMWAQGVKNVPRPIAFDKKHKHGVYSYLFGKKFNKTGEIHKKHVEKACDFLERLHELSKIQAAQKLGQASEACLTINNCLTAVWQRLDRLKNIKDKQLTKFLKSDFLPFFQTSIDLLQKHAQKQNVFLNQSADDMQTLSPSDFGFHNILKQKNGSLAFVDFEYFGWDDAAKMTADFLLQPRVPLPIKHRVFVATRVYNFLDKNKLFIKRLPYYYLLLSFNWCLIMLNTFLEENDTNQQNLQLLKAKQKLKSISWELEKRVYPLSLI